jgi:tRNA(Glu) U13 pseudouridine synthase TruD
MRAVLRDPDVSGGVDEFGPYVRVAFELPRGAFATSILREIMKSEGHAAAEEPGEEG